MSWCVLSRYSTFIQSAPAIKQKLHLNDCFFSSQSHSDRLLLVRPPVCPLSLCAYLTNWLAVFLSAFSFVSVSIYSACLPDCLSTCLYICVCTCVFIYTILEIDAFQTFLSKVYLPKLIFTPRKVSRCEKRSTLRMASFDYNYSALHYHTGVKQPM